MQRFIIYIAVVLLVVFAACSRRPSYVIQEEKMVDLLCDIQLAQAVYNSDNQFSPNEKKDRLIEGVLKKHKVTQADLDSSLLWYADNIAYYEVINDSVASRLRTKSDRIVASRSISSTSTNYLIPPFFKLSNYTSTMYFDIDSVKIKDLDASKFHLSFNTQGVSSKQNVEAAIYFTYRDTLVYKTIDIEKDKSYIFSKPNLPDSLLKSITGYIHLRDIPKNVSQNVLLYNINYLDSLSLDKENGEIFRDSNKNTPKRIRGKEEPVTTTEEPEAAKADEVSFGTGRKAK